MKLILLSFIILLLVTSMVTSSGVENDHEKSSKGSPIISKRSIPYFSDNFFYNVGKHKFETLLNLYNHMKEKFQILTFFFNFDYKPAFEFLKRTFQILKKTTLLFNRNDEEPPVQVNDHLFMLKKLFPKSKNKKNGFLASDGQMNHEASGNPQEVHIDLPVYEETHQGNIEGQFAGAQNVDEEKINNIQNRHNPPQLENTARNDIQNEINRILKEINNRNNEKNEESPNVQESDVKVAGEIPEDDPLVEKSTVPLSEDLLPVKFEDIVNRNGVLLSENDNVKQMNEANNEEQVQLPTAERINVDSDILMQLTPLRELLKKRLQNSQQMSKRKKRQAFQKYDFSSEKVHNASISNASGKEEREDKIKNATGSISKKLRMKRDLSGRFPLLNTLRQFQRSVQFGIGRNYFGSVAAVPNFKVNFPANYQQVVAPKHEFRQNYAYSREYGLPDVKEGHPVYGLPKLEDGGSVILEYTYGTPKPVYGSPKPVYGPPKPVYGSPKPVYESPKPVYGSPKPVYGPPKQEYWPPKLEYGVLSTGAAIEPTHGMPKPVYGTPNYEHRLFEADYKVPGTIGTVNIESAYGLPKHMYGPPKEGNYFLKSEYEAPKTDGSTTSAPMYESSKPVYGIPKEATPSHRENAATKSAYSVPKSVFEIPKEESGSPKSKYDAPKPVYGTPKQEYMPPKLEYEVPKNRENFSQESTFVIPKSAYGIPKEDEVPKLEYGAPKTKENASKSTYEVPKSEEEPKLEYKAQKINENVPKFTHEVSKSAYEIPKELEEPKLEYGMVHGISTQKHKVSKLENNRENITIQSAYDIPKSVYKIPKEENTSAKLEYGVPTIRENVTAGYETFKTDGISSPKSKPKPAYGIPKQEYKLQVPEYGAQNMPKQEYGLPKLKYGIPQIEESVTPQFTHDTKKPLYTIPKEGNLPPKIIHEIPEKSKSFTQKSVQHEYTTPKFAESKDGMPKLESKESSGKAEVHQSQLFHKKVLLFTENASNISQNGIDSSNAITQNLENERKINFRLPSLEQRFEFSKQDQSNEEFEGDDFTSFILKKKTPQQESNAFFEEDQRVPNWYTRTSTQHKLSPMHHQQNAIPSTKNEGNSHPLPLSDEKEDTFLQEAEKAIAPISSENHEDEAFKNRQKEAPSVQQRIIIASEDLTVPKEPTHSFKIQHSTVPKQENDIIFEESQDKIIQQQDVLFPDEFENISHGSNQNPKEISGIKPKNIPPLKSRIVLTEDIRTTFEKNDLLLQEEEKHFSKKAKDVEENNTMVPLDAVLMSDKHQTNSHKLKQSYKEISKSITKFASSEDKQVRLPQKIVTFKKHQNSSKQVHEEVKKSSLLSTSSSRNYQHSPRRVENSNSMLNRTFSELSGKNEWGLYQHYGIPKTRLPNSIRWFQSDLENFQDNKQLGAGKRRFKESIPSHENVAKRRRRRDLSSRFPILNTLRNFQRIVKTSREVTRGRYFGETFPKKVKYITQEYGTQSDNDKEYGLDWLSSKYSYEHDGIHKKKEEKHDSSLLKKETVQNFSAEYGLPHGPSSERVTIPKPSVFKHDTATNTGIHNQISLKNGLLIRESNRFRYEKYGLPKDFAEEVVFPKQSMEEYGLPKLFIEGNGFIKKSTVEKYGLQSTSVLDKYEIRNISSEYGIPEEPKNFHSENYGLPEASIINFDKKQRYNADNFKLPNLLKKDTFLGYEENEFSAHKNQNEKKSYFGSISSMFPRRIGRDLKIQIPLSAKENKYLLADDAVENFEEKIEDALNEKLKGINLGGKHYYKISGSLRNNGTILRRKRNLNDKDREEETEEEKKSTMFLVEEQETKQGKQKGRNGRILPIIVSDEVIQKSTDVKPKITKKLLEEIKKFHFVSAQKHPLFPMEETKIKVEEFRNHVDEEEEEETPTKFDETSLSAKEGDNQKRFIPSKVTNQSLKPVEDSKILKLKKAEIPQKKLLEVDSKFAEGVSEQKIHSNDKNATMEELLPLIIWTQYGRPRKYEEGLKDHEDKYKLMVLSNRRFEREKYEVLRDVYNAIYAKKHAIYGLPSGTEYTIIDFSKKKGQTIYVKNETMTSAPVKLTLPLPGKESEHSTINELIANISNIISTIENQTKINDVSPQEKEDHSDRAFEESKSSVNLQEQASLVPIVEASKGSNNENIISIQTFDANGESIKILVPMTCKQKKVSIGIENKSNRIATLTVDIPFVDDDEEERRNRSNNLELEKTNTTQSTTDLEETITTEREEFITSTTSDDYVNESSSEDTALNPKINEDIGVALMKENTVGNADEDLSREEEELDLDATTNIPSNNKNEEYHDKSNENNNEEITTALYDESFKMVTLKTNHSNTKSFKGKNNKQNESRVLEHNAVSKTELSQGYPTEDEDKSSEILLKTLSESEDTVSSKKENGYQEFQGPAVYENDGPLRITLEIDDGKEESDFLMNDSSLENNFKKATEEDDMDSSSNESEDFGSKESATEQEENLAERELSRDMNPLGYGNGSLDSIATDSSLEERFEQPTIAQLEPTSQSFSISDTTTLTYEENYDFTLFGTKLESTTIYEAVNENSYPTNVDVDFKEVSSVGNQQNSEDVLEETTVFPKDDLEITARGFTLEENPAEEKFEATTTFDGKTGDAKSLHGVQIEDSRRSKRESGYGISYSESAPTTEPIEKEAIDATNQAIDVKEILEESSTRAPEKNEIMLMESNEEIMKKVEGFSTSSPILRHTTTVLVEEVPFLGGSSVDGFSIRSKDQILENCTTKNYEDAEDFTASEHAQTDKDSIEKESIKDDFLIENVNEERKLVEDLTEEPSRGEDSFEEDSLGENTRSKESTGEKSIKSTSSSTEKVSVVTPAESNLFLSPIFTHPKQIGRSKDSKDANPLFNQKYEREDAIKVPKKLGPAKRENVTFVFPSLNLFMGNKSTIDRSLEENPHEEITADRKRLAKRGSKEDAETFKSVEGWGNFEEDIEAKKQLILERLQRRLEQIEIYSGPFRAVAPSVTTKNSSSDTMTGSTTTEIYGTSPASTRNEENNPNVKKRRKFIPRKKAKNVQTADSYSRVQYTNMKKPSWRRNPAYNKSKGGKFSRKNVVIVRPQTTTSSHPKMAATENREFLKNEFGKRLKTA